MTAEEAQILQARIAAAEGWVMWFVIAHPSGALAARAMVADQGGGHQEAGDLFAGTIEELRAMLPTGLTRRDRTMMLPADVLETWDRVGQMQLSV